MNGVDVGSQHLRSYLHFHGTTALTDGDTAIERTAQKELQLGKAISHMVVFDYLCRIEDA